MAKTEMTEAPEHYKSIIDEYYINGFNRVKAVRAIKGEEYNYNSAVALFNAAYKHNSTQAYIAAKQSRLRAITTIKNENVLRELMNWAYSDIGDYLTLSPEEIKELPAEIRRCIASVQHKKKRYTTRGGEDVEEETLTIKLIDKVKAMESISKHIGFYLEDNKQKAVKIDIKQLNVGTLNALLQAATTDTNDH